MVVAFPITPNLMRAFILAGGFATRLWPLTEKRAKPLLPLAGKPIIEHIMEQIPQNVPVNISTNALFETGFIEWLQNRNDTRTNLLIEQTVKDDQKLGALGAVAQWIEQEHVADDVLLLTGDNYFGFSLQTFLESAPPGKTLLAAYDIGNTERARAFGTVVTDAHDTVTAFEEKPSNPRTTLVSTGCSLLPRHILPILVEHAQTHPDNVGGLFEELLKQGEIVQCFAFTEPWFDIGSFHAYMEATKELVGDNVRIAHSSTCEKTKTEGSVLIGEHCRVRNATLTNVVLFEGCTVENCELRNCIVDTGCSLQNIDLSGKMLRAGTVLQT